MAGEEDTSGTVVIEEPEVVETPTPDEAATLREENARLRGENAVLREPRREPTPPVTPTPPADPIASEFDTIEKAFATGAISEADRTIRLGALGAKGEIARREREQRDDAARTRDEQAKTRSGQTIAVYLEKHPGLSSATGPEMQRVLPHLRAVAEEFGLDGADPRAQVLALERVYGPIARSPHVDTHEFERRRHPGGGGGGTFGDEPTPRAQPASPGAVLFDKLLPEYQAFYIQTRGSKEAAIKTLAHADEHQMRKQGRFK